MSAFRSLGNFAGGVTGGYLAGAKNMRDTRLADANIDLANKADKRAQATQDADMNSLKELVPLLHQYLSANPPGSAPTAQAGAPYRTASVSPLAQSMMQPQAATPFVTDSFAPRRVNTAIPYADNMPALAATGD